MFLSCPDYTVCLLVDNHFSCSPHDPRKKNLDVMLLFLKGMVKHQPHFVWPSWRVRKEMWSSLVGSTMRWKGHHRTITLEPPLMRKAATPAWAAASALPAAILQFQNPSAYPRSQTPTVSTRYGTKLGFQNLQGTVSLPVTYLLSFCLSSVSLGNPNPHRTGVRTPKESLMWTRATSRILLVGHTHPIRASRASGLPMPSLGQGWTDITGSARTALRLEF